MKKIILFFIFIVPLNAFSQSKENLSFKLVLVDSIKRIVGYDVDRRMGQFKQYFRSRVNDEANTTYFRETVMISFNSEEYSEMITDYSREDDGLTEKISRARTAQRLRQIDAAMQRENRILHDLFDCFIYPALFTNNKKKFLICCKSVKLLLFLR